jgi:hypothetical protein
MRLLRQVMLKGKVHHTLKTLRYKLFATAAYITQDGRKRIVHLAMKMERREWFSGLWDQAKNFDLPVYFETPVHLRE